MEADTLRVCEFPGDLNVDSLSVTTDLASGFHVLACAIEGGGSQPRLIFPMPD